MYNQNENQTNYQPDYSKMTIREEIEDRFKRLKNFPIAMETINKAKTYLLEWETIFANDISDKELIATNINSTSKKKKLYSVIKNEQKI